MLSKRVLFSSNTDKKVQLKAFNKPLYPPGVGFNIPAPFRKFELDVYISGYARQGPFEDLVSTYCSERLSEIVKRSTKEMPSFPDLQKTIEDQGDSSAWDIAIQDFTESVRIGFLGIGNYKAIVMSLCEALENAAPGVSIAVSEMIKPGKRWNEDSLKEVARQEGVNLGCMEAMDYSGSSMYVFLADTHTKNEGQLMEFMQYMRKVSVEYKVPFLTDRVDKISTFFTVF